MLRKFLLVVLIPLAAGAFTVDKGPIVYGITHSYANFLWRTTDSTYDRLAWDTTSHSGDSDTTNYAHKIDGYRLGKLHSTYFGGLPANTPIYVRVCGWDGASTTVCAAETSFTTLALPATHPAYPTAPEAFSIDKPTCANGELNCVSSTPVTHTVASDCSDFQSIYNAAAWGDTIIIPGGTVCGTDQFIPTAKGSHDGTKYIVITTDASIPANGSRLQSSDVAALPRIEQTNYSHYTAVTNEYCYPGSYAWTSVGATAGWYMKHCEVDQNKAVTSFAPATTANGYNWDVVLTSAFTDIQVNDVLRVHGATGFTKLQDLAMIQVVSVTNSTHFQVTTYNSICGGTDAYNKCNGTSGGSAETYTGSGNTLDRFLWVDTPYQAYTGVKPTSSCTTGEWAWSDEKPGGGALSGNASFSNYRDTNYGTARVWRCVDTNIWSPHYVIYDRYKQDHDPNTAAFRLDTAHHLWIEGLNFTHAAVPYEADLRATGGNMSNLTQGATQGGTAPATFAWTGPYSHHIVFDRNAFIREYPAKGDQVVTLNGAYIQFTGNYVNTFGAWYGAENRTANVDNQAGDVVSVSWGGPKFIDNNYLEGYGITLHINDSANGCGGTTCDSHDLTITRNYFYRDFEKIYGAPGSTTDIYMPLRQLLEFKRGNVAKIDGNIFKHNFRNVSQGAAIAHTNVAAGGLDNWCDFTYDGDDLLCTTRSPADLVDGDYVQMQQFADDMFQVTDIGTSGNFVTFRVLSCPGLIDAGFNKTFNVLTTREGISDLEISNNTFDTVPNVISGFSHIERDSEYYAGMPRQSERIYVHNNIIYNFGPLNLQLPEDEQWQTAGASGYCWILWGPNCDVRVEHNTVHTLNPSAVYALGTFFQPEQSDNLDKPQNEGIIIRNNLLWGSNGLQPVYFAAGSLNGNNALDDFTRSGTVRYTMDGNVTVRSGGDPGNYDSTNKFYAYVGAVSPFADVPNLDMTLAVGGIGQSTSTCFSVPGDCTTDGTDAGVDMAALTTAQNTGCTYSIDPTSHTYTFALSSFDVTVTASDAACVADITYPDAWVYGPSTTGVGTVSISVQLNTGAERTSTVTIGGRSFSVTQTAPPVGTTITGVSVFSGATVK